MPLPLPNLDTRRWADLVDEGRSIVPRYAGSWTDHNVHDPGIMLIELFAFLVENLSYRVNHIPERHRRKFLALAGFSAKPPAGARAIVRARLAGGAGQVVLPADLVVVAETERGPVEFSVQSETTVVEAELRSLQAFDGTSFVDCSRFLVAGLSYPAFGDDPSSDASDQPALYLGFDRPLPPGVMLSVYVDVPASSTDTARLLRDEERLQRCPPPPPNLGCTPRPPATTPSPCATNVAPPVTASTSASDPASSRVPPHHSARVVWEYLALDTWRPLDASPGFIDDRTRSLTLSGPVRVRVPAPMAFRVEGCVTEPRSWIRCRFARGVYDGAPRIRGPIFNAVPVIQSVAVSPAKALAPEAATEGSGLPDQVVRLSESKVADARIVVETVEPSGVHRWSQRSDFDASRPGDPHFTLDPGQAILRFGNGARGRVPPDASQFLVSYSVTEGAAGQVSAGRSWSLADNPANQSLLATSGLTVAGVTVALQCLNNPFAAWGGADTELLDSVARRAADLLWAHERLVQLAGTGEQATLDQLDPIEVQKRPVPRRGTTGLDFERLALGVPGTVVRRAKAWTNFDPALPCLDAAGTITVVIVPELPADRPSPSAGLLGTVRGYLSRRRVLGTRVLVVGPEYVTLAVQATLVARRTADPGAVEQDVVNALRCFLHPLKGGPVKRGWPFGRDVCRSEILAVISEVRGVDHVEECVLIPDGAAVPCANVCIPPTSLFESGAHQITVVSA